MISQIFYFLFKEVSEKLDTIFCRREQWKEAPDCRSNFDNLGTVRTFGANAKLEAVVDEQKRVDVPCGLICNFEAVLKVLE